MERYQGITVRLKTVALLLLLSVLGSHAGAQEAPKEQLITLPTRPNIHISYWWMPHEKPIATVLLFAGGHGGMGLKDQQPQSENFLIRSRWHFYNAGMNVALIGNPSDHLALTPAFRASAPHNQDIEAIVQNIRRHSTAALWLIGTSQGSISAAANAIAFGDAIAGLVLSSSISAPQPGGSVPDLALEKITRPVLIYQHLHDACDLTPASSAEKMLPRLSQAIYKKYWPVTGGDMPSGNTCSPSHFHGFVGMQAQAVQDITDWIQHPSN